VYPVAIIGDTLAARLATLACHASGFDDVKRYQDREGPAQSPEIYSLGANASRLLNALAPHTIENIAFCPDRFQIRFAKSAYLLAELPLGDFYHQRYGSPMMNIAGPALRQCLDAGLSHPLLAPMALAEAERSHALTILSSRTPVGKTGDGDFNVFHASLTDHPLRRANVLWRGKGQYIEQVADTGRVHFRFVTRQGTDFAFADWHESLHPALEAKIQSRDIFVTELTHSETLFGGSVAFLSDAVAPPITCKIDGANTALEDAWVLSRMMENYEEDIADGLAAYERFRRPRHRKVMAGLRSHLTTLTEPSSMKRVGQHVGTALQNRLLPEIALQRQDWLYQHDVIKGFR
jgi:hypothetical protein